MSTYKYKANPTVLVFMAATVVIIIWALVYLIWLAVR